ncbi:RHOMBOID-like protein 1 [Malus sylvestris]|uniref:RHOMBOID-like protein 1 n=1 Tax=Malus sylvestris TaxID=3752 RepID=UPI0021AD0CCF|nr:RHOMBOID-like protein 1 [Malus sylvestris]
MGALDAQRVVHQHQGCRLISCMWLHAGVFHVLANMLSLVFIGIRLEQEFGFAVGILPHVDNVAHIGGFVSRFLLGFLFLICPQFKWLTQRNAPPGYVTTPVKSKHKTYQYVLWVLSLILLIVGYTLGLATLFRGVNLNNHCSWCHYLRCVPTSKWNCKSQNIYCLIICCTFLRILTSALIFDRHKCLLINMIMVAFSRSSLACRLV